MRDVRRQAEAGQEKGREKKGRRMAGEDCVINRARHGLDSTAKALTSGTADAVIKDTDQALQERENRFARGSLVGYGECGAPQQYSLKFTHYARVGGFS